MEKTYNVSLPSRADLPRLAAAQKGLALVTALLVVAIVATLAAYLGFTQQVWLRQVENVVDRAQGEAVLRGALDAAVILLQEDAKLNSTDHLQEAWAITPMAGPVGTGDFIATARDMQGRFNLNNLLAADGAPSAPDLALFRRLLQRLDLDASLADAVVDWLDADSRRLATGAEDIEYLGLSPGYRTGNTAMRSPEELRLVKGFTPQVMQLLLESAAVTALPERTAININTAPEILIQVMFPEPPPEAALSAVLTQRAEQPFDDKDELLKRLPQGLKAPEVEFDVKTGYFGVTVNTRFGRLDRWSEALIQRPAKQMGRIIWQSRRVLLIGTEPDDNTA